MGSSLAVAPERPSVTRLPKGLRHAAFWVASGLLALIGTATLALAIGDLGRPFPGFALLADRTVPFTLVSSWTGAKAGLRTMDRILAIDGRPVQSDGEVVAHARTAPAGTRVRYDVERVDAGDRRKILTFEVPTQRFGLQDWVLSALMFSLTGLVYLVLGAVVSRLRPGVAVARAHLAFSWAAAFVYLKIYLQSMGYGCPTWLDTLGGLALGAATVNLALMLPRRMGGARLPWLQAGNAAVWAGLAGVSIWAVAEDRLRLLTHVGPWILALAANFVLLGNLAWTAIDRHSTDAERAQGAIVAGGLALAMSGGLVMELGALGSLPPWSILAANILMFGTPVGIAAAIVYYRLFAIEVPFRRSLTYGLLAALLTVLYLLVAGGLGALGAAAGFNELAGTLAVAAAILPLRDVIRKWLDRALFRTAYDPIEVVDRFAKRSRRIADPGDLADALCDLVRESLAPEWLRIEPEGAAPAAGAHLRFPLGLGPAAAGALALGPRKSGLPYSDTDRHLLSSLSEQVGHWLELYRHIDAVRSLEAERDAARHSEAMQRAFLGLVSHELRTPLSTIALSAEAIGRSGAPGTGGGADAVEPIRRATASLTRFVEDLLDAAQIEAGVFKVRPEEVDLVEIAKGAARELRPLAECEDQELVVEASPEPLPVRGDRQRLLQVFRNLLHNASKFTPTGGRIRLTVKAEGGVAVAAVADSGPGLIPEEAARAFTRFGRGDRLARHGAGLGLYIAKELVEAHGGSIAVASAPGHGAVFAVRIPLARPAGGVAGQLVLAAEPPAD